ncbi:MAG: hypothetical protein JWL85_298 [Candidatus Saccharibacteria bacterium]|nr:hypothetical protein [Candidatus Saccharibacteria bacterium]
MTILFIIAAAVILLFGFVVFFGAPYLPTMKRQTETALDMLDLKPGQILLELGCGDGRVLRAAAERGLNVVGYELNPILALFAWIYTLKYRKQVKVIWGNYWLMRWPVASGIFVFLLDNYMEKLDKKIVQEYGGNVKLVSYAFQIPDKKPLKEKDGLYLYKY